MTARQTSAELPAELPAGLRDRVMTASGLARPAGQPVPAVVAASATEVFGRTADAFYGLLTSLSEADWAAPTIRGLDVQGLVGHLIGVEDDIHRCLSSDPAVADADHVASTAPAAASQAGRAPALTLQDWRRAAGHTLRLIAAGDLDSVVAVHGVRLPVRDLLVARAFELWTHDNDIRAAVVLPPSVPGPETLRPMTLLAAALLPFGAALVGLDQHVSLRLVLIGPGGGTWDVLLGRPSSDPVPIAVTADVVGFCRLFANRIAPADLDAQIRGDSALATRVLAGAASLALD